MDLSFGRIELTCSIADHDASGHKVSDFAIGQVRKDVFPKFIITTIFVYYFHVCHFHKSADVVLELHNVVVESVAAAVVA